MRVLAFLLVMLASFFASAKSLTVCTSCELKSIQQAVDVAQPHDAIFVKTGVYITNEVELTKPLSLIGEEGSILDANGKGEILIIHSDSVNILNLTLRNVGMSYTKDWAAISSDKAKHGRIENCKLTNTFFGIYLRKSKSFSIKNNVIISNATEEFTSGNAIHLWYCDSMQIEDNEVRQHRDGIYFEFVKNSLIRNNISEGNVRYGLHFMFSDDNLYQQNTFEDNGSGVAVMYGSRIEMTGNQFINNWGPASYGLLLKEIKDSKIENNVFRKNTTAIYGEGAMRMHISKNTFESNGWAIKILSSCMENVVKDNDFLANSFSVFTNSSHNHNTFINNYWSEYKGYDLNRDGIGDVPHRPVSLFTYIVEQSEPALLLMRSNFIALLEIAEKAAPAITPVSLIDSKPRMNPYGNTH